MRRWNEQTKLLSAALDRAGTVVLGGGLLAPIFGGQYPGRGGFLFLLAAIGLHLLGRMSLYLLEEET